MIPAAVLVVLATVMPAAAQDVPVRAITASIDLGTADPGADHPAADAFYGSLDASDGLVVWLDLTLIPARGEAAGYDLRRLEDGSGIACGDGLFGTVDNLQTMLSLGFNHPNHFHAPVMIHIGDRLDYPRHDITCAASMDVPTTALHLNGHFIVETAEVPTAITYTLFPFDAD